MLELRNLIHGELVAPVGGSYLEDTNPATGKVFALVPDSDERDVELAVNAAAQAFPTWSNTAAKERSDILQRISGLISDNLERLATAESDDTGKPVWLAKDVDIPRAASNFHFFATGLLHFASESHSMDGLAINYTLRQPLGVVGCISPWNLPLYLFTWKIAPALAAGNCVVAKPSEITPLTVYHLSELCIEAGLPPGVLNIVHGYGPKVGAAITTHDQVKAITFTGGTKTGAQIALAAAPKFKKLSLELGGKNPNIIFADCDYDDMLDTTLRSSFSNQGEICLCGSRIFVERSLYERFRQDFVARTQQLKVGDPRDPEVDLGAIVSESHKEKIQSYVRLAREEGGTVLCGGEEVRVNGRCQQGAFITPAVIEGLAYDCRTNQEEIFGPVVTITPFDTESQVVGYANSVPYGLSATIWTQHLTRAHRLAEQLQVGIVWVNCWLLRDLRTPFGGTKASGVGREGGWEAFRFFTEPKNICVKLVS